MSKRKLISQRDIMDLIDLNTTPDENDYFSDQTGITDKGLINNFVVRRNNNGNWEVEFSTSKNDKCGVKLKEGSVREFSRLNGIEKFMKLIGVTEFKVIM